MTWLARVRKRLAAMLGVDRDSAATGRTDEHGAFGVVFRWKEQTVYSDGDREYAFRGAWGVEPVHTYVPDEQNWDRCLPDWLHGRRDLIVARLQSVPGHRVRTDPGYPAPSDYDFSSERIIIVRKHPPATDT